VTDLFQGVIRGFQGLAGNLQGGKIRPLHHARQLDSLPQHERALARGTHQANHLNHHKELKHLHHVETCFYCP